MRIFVTVGFENFPFDRLLEAIAAGIKRRLIAGEVFVQTGHSRYQVQGCESDRFMGFDSVVSHLEEADIVVSHAGVGTTLLCLALGKIPILFPRQSRYREHVDDHQVQFARKMESQGKALVAYDEDDLLAKIGQYGALVNGEFVNRRKEKAPSLRRCLEEMLAGSAGRERISK